MNNLKSMRDIPGKQIVKYNDKVSKLTLKLIKDSLSQENNLSILNFAIDSYAELGTMFVYIANESGDMVLYTNLDRHNCEDEVERRIYYKDSKDEINKFLKAYHGSYDLLVIGEFNKSSSDDIYRNQN